MRAQEFVTEMRQGKLSTRNRAATVGLNVFSDSEKSNSDYTLNRVMMAVAMADGSGAPIDMDGKSWVGKKTHSKSIYRSRTSHAQTSLQGSWSRL